MDPSRTSTGMQVEDVLEDVDASLDNRQSLARTSSSESRAFIMQPDDGALPRSRREPGLSRPTNAGSVNVLNGPLENIHNNERVNVINQLPSTEATAEFILTGRDVHFDRMPESGRYVIDANYITVGGTTRDRGGEENHCYTQDDQAIGGSLVTQQNTLVLAREKLQYQASKVDNTSAFAGCVNLLFGVGPLKHRHIQSELYVIAQLFQLLDGKLARYFQSNLVPGMARDDISYGLERAREVVSKDRNERSGPGVRAQTSDNVILSDLGRFCEDVFSGNGTATFKPTDNTVEATLRYLQDAYLDIPYWQLMLDFLAHQVNGTVGPEPELFIRVISHIKLDVLSRKAKILEYAEDAATEGLDVEFHRLGCLLSGIDARTASLDNVKHPHALHLELNPLLSTLFQQKCPADLKEEQDLLRKEQERLQEEQKLNQICAPGPGEETAEINALSPSTEANAELQDKSEELAINLGLFALIVLPSLIFGTIAFNISWNAKEPGTYEDADFWNLLQSTTLSSVGSLALVISMIRDKKTTSRWSVARIITYVLWLASFAWGIVSVCIYTSFNTAYSSGASTLSGMLALLTPLMLMLATPGQAVGEKKAKRAEVTKEKKDE